MGSEQIIPTWIGADHYKLCKKKKKDEVGALGKLKNQGEKKIGISKQNKTKELK